MALAALRLWVSDPAERARLYEQTLGMVARQEEGNWRVGYAGEDADLLLMPGGGGFTPDRGQRYWKIGVTLPDVDLAAAHLHALGISTTEPSQFLDIGYMCHLSDPAGFVIELLQHDFQGNRPESAADPAAPFAAGTIGQITLRTGDIEAEDANCRGLGMRPLSMQGVARYGFDLHFYGFTDEVPPNPDLWSVENREWLWKRPYTTLEYQYLQSAEFSPVPNYKGLEITGLQDPTTDAFGDPLLPG